jgi:uncharacterized protein with HEPN domain
MNEIKEIFKIIDTMISYCEIDYNELKSQKIDDSFFKDYHNVRLVNSFLFSYSKIQDKIGSKLFRKVLYELKEIDDEDMPMRDILNLLEKLSILDKASDWDRLREIRNNLTHEYPFDIQERIENIFLAFEGFELLKTIYENLKRKYFQNI